MIATGPFDFGDFECFGHIDVFDSTSNKCQACIHLSECEGNVELTEAGVGSVNESRPTKGAKLDDYDILAKSIIKRHAF